MDLRSAVHRRLERYAPRLDDRLVVAAWRRRNRRRQGTTRPADPALAPLVEQLRSDGVAISDAEAVFGPGGLEEATARAWALHEQPRPAVEAEAGSKATFLTKLATGRYEAADPFVGLALHPNALAVANAYLGLRSSLRSLDLWLTRPTPGPAIQTQLWHRDADDVVNLKMFVYFSDVTREAGPLCYAPRTQPLGKRRRLAERDAHGRSTDDQLARIVPPEEWRFCEGKAGTVVFADTCGYHKQVKPASDERLLLVAQYVSGTPFVEQNLSLDGLDDAELSPDQRAAVPDA